MLEARRCPTCGESYFPPTQFCLKDGAQLVISQTLIGKVLDDRYRIDSLLGAGGMGTVYRATHLHLESEFAVKVLHPELIANEGHIERFRREAKAARRIHHPNAIEVTDFGVTAEKLVYLVMEIVEGRLLSDVIKEGPFDYRRAVEILCQISAAIEIAHQKNVIHRDLKPDNIIVQKVGNEEKVKVLDFGIAKLLESDQLGIPQRALTKAGMLVGTPQYMSPEQCQGKELEPQSDIYSLGIIAYEMLSGAPPFLSSKPMGYIAKHIREIPEPLRNIAPNVPTQIDEVIMRALEKEPQHRQASAAELARQLRIAVREADELSNNTTMMVEHTSGKVTAAMTPTEETFIGRPSRPYPTEIARGGRETEMIPAGRSTKDPPPRKTVDPTSGEFVSDTPFPPRTKPRRRWIGIAAALLMVLGVGLYFAFFRDNGSEKNQNGNTAGKITPGEMAPIRGGKFMMGRSDGEDDERPPHEVTVPDFLLDKYEVTNQQYKKCVEAKQCPAPGNWKNGVYDLEDALLPVTYVTWEAAMSYAKWAGKRLPTEAEWEYVARGGAKGNLYPWGNQWQERAANIARTGAVKPAPVGSFDVDQSLGVFDLIGNVSEWVQDSYKLYGANKSVESCPTCKVYRGSSFADGISDSAATHRWATFPTAPQDADSKKLYEDKVFRVVGFRCAKDEK